MIAIGLDFALECELPYLPLYLDHHETCVIVDRVDYDWAQQWRWRVKWDKHGRKAYATRALGINGNGRRHLTVTLYLHKEICRRAHGLPPSPRHTIGDHCNGVSLDCRRSNLRWATPSMNRLNIDGWYARQLRLQLEAHQ